MNSRTRPVAALAIAVAALVPAALFAQTTERVNVATGGFEANGDGEFPSLSGDGRLVAFWAYASNLVAGDTNGYEDIFVRDRQSGTTARVSLSTPGAQADAFSRGPALSADGRFVAFFSGASNLVVGDTNAHADVFVHERATGKTARVSVASGLTQANGASEFPAISADGRFVAFVSNASNLVASDNNATWDVFVHDRQNGTTELASLSTAGLQGDADYERPAISADGRCVAFRSFASNLVAGDTNGWADLFVRDRQNATTERVSIASNGTQGNSGSSDPSLSADGRYVAFRSVASNLVAGDDNGKPDVFVHDRLNATTERASVATGGSDGNGYSDAASISAGGRFVAFRSLASNLVASDTNGATDVFVHDRLTGTTELVSVDSAGNEGNSYSEWPSISADGRIVAFRSNASNLVAGDTNGYRDIFVRELGAPTPTSYCTAGTTSNGCNASIAASANPSLSLAHSCNLTVANVEGQKSGLLFYGVDNSSFTPLPWAPASTSYLCVKLPAQRTAIQSSGGTTNFCDGSYVLDWNAYQAAHTTALGNPWSVGAKVYAQAWFRDPLAAKSTNLSSAIELTYVP